MSTKLVEAPVADTCLSTEELLQFAQGLLPNDHVGRLEAHVDSCAVCCELLYRAVRGVNSRPDAPWGRGETMFREGMVVGGRFRIVRYVAKGGMGEVYEARDLELDTTVALKTIARRVSDNERAVRWLKVEVLHARSVAHSNVCRIYEWGTHFDPDSDARVHFFTMEFVHGERLGKRVRGDGPLRTELALDVARQLLLGLEAAHVAGILHRDFKSDNVILSGEAGKPRAVILDFGLSRELDGEPGASGFGVVGTIPYMAPEQLQGAQLGPSADVYAFGVVLFEILTQRCPDENDKRALATTPARFAPQIPAGIAAVLSRCLRAEPEQRFQSAEEVLAALDASKPRIEMSGSRSSPLSRARVVPAALIALSLFGATYSSMVGQAQPVSSSPIKPPPAEPVSQPAVPAKPSQEPQLRAEPHHPSTDEASRGHESPEKSAQKLNRAPNPGRKPSRPGPVKVSVERKPATSLPTNWESFDGPSAAIDASRTVASSEVNGGR